MEKSKLNYAYELLSPKVYKAVTLIPEIERMRIQEIRMRLGRKLTATVFGKEYAVTSQGRLLNCFQDGVDITVEDMDITFKRAFQNSVHSFHKEITQGYITCEGGNRVGFSGTAVLSQSHQAFVENVKNISSINIRIAREIINAGKSIFDKSLLDKPSGIIIGGPPSSGKTTVLRDLCRLVGNKYSLSIIDERGELANCVGGVAQNDIGMLSDVFNSYNKYEGVLTAVKVMSPQIIICDEIGTEDDLTALRYGVNSRAKIIATCHCSDFNELKKRPVISKLIKEKVFDFGAILGKESLCGQLTAFYKLGDNHDDD